ncbi:dipeptide epimerase [Rhizobiaceae bacterium BDR2-2]|uniref:Dipeptide epimerase n=1 Tax=Ectorhizobium quercum TaxID=2965071 RepID=A0AAE3N2N0_9HYPH|nr:N-acetyl-D-Glu racemase DgcA [Ectorhizobium quercum]MCX8997532.1 dipeptide epimerase [Ectorhizobium quercum]
MSRRLEATIETFPISGGFTISRGTKTQAHVITCVIAEGNVEGRGECVPYARYGETLDGVLADIHAAAPAIAAGLTRQELLTAMKPGAARNAIDCALWDLEAGLSDVPAAARILAAPAKPLVTAYTISLGEPDVMAAKAAENAHRPLLKVKVGTGDDESRIRAVCAAAPRSTVILDANEGWPEDRLAHHIAVSSECGVALVEQPLPAGRDAALRDIERLVTICADESVHTGGDLAALRDRYDAINIKLDKTGGLTEALTLKRDAQALGFKIMIGCMVGSSLGMAPALLLAQDAEFVDLDGPLLLARDRVPGLVYEGSLVLPPEQALWG